MRRLAVVTIVLGLAAAAPAAALAGAIDLRLAYRADQGAPLQVFTLHCGSPVTGTVPRPAAACRKLIALGPTAFAPTPRGRACAQLYGGPQTALVTGIYYGKPVWTRLSRVDGCANARWQKVAFLFPASDS